METVEAPFFEFLRTAIDNNYQDAHRTPPVPLSWMWARPDHGYPKGSLVRVLLHFL